MPRWIWERAGAGFASLIYEDSYHFGSAGCKAVTDCASSELVALEVQPGQICEAYIWDRSARIPPTGVPVSVPRHE